MKYDPRNLSRVYFRDDDGHYWEIPYRDLRLPPISLWEHQAAIKKLQTEGRRAVDEGVLFAIVEEQRRLAESAQKSTRDRRAMERRQQNVRSSSASSVTERTAQTPDTVDRKSVQPFEVEEWD